MEFKFKPLLFLFLVIGDVVTAQTVDTAAEILRREGQNVELTIQLGEPLKIFVSGKERARFRSTDLKLEVKTLKKGHWEELRLNKFGNYYTVTAPTALQSGKSMEIRTTLKNKKSETFKIELNKE